MKRAAIVIFGVLAATGASADYVASEAIGIEMVGKGKTAKLWSFELSEGANQMLHGYVPQQGDVVEFYVRQADCVIPDEKCNFEIAIRKKEQP